MKFIVDKFMMEKKCQHFLIILILQDRLIVLDGWSKAYCYDRLENGLECVARRINTTCNKLIINSVSCVNAPSQFAGIAALDGSDDPIHEMMENLIKRRKINL